MSNFANRLKKKRLSANITQKQLANFLNVSQNAVFNWENGKRQPSFEIIEQIACFLDVSPSELMGWNDDVVSHFHHNSVMTLASIYATFGYELYVLCDIYLSIDDKYKNQLLSFANYLIKCDRGKDFSMPTEEDVSEMFPIERFNELLTKDYDDYWNDIKTDASKATNEDKY